jgi:murein DD-endopeptidase MepM/ murein hydrolase activator NlpD
MVPTERRASGARSVGKLPRLTLVAALATGTAGSAGAAPSVVDRCGFALTVPVEQGQLVRGRADPACRIHVGGREARISPHGHFAFGISRDATGTVEIELTDADGRRGVESRPIATRRFAIQRIDGVPPAMVEPPPEIAARIARERAAIAAVRARDDDRPDFAESFIWPVRGRISGVYGSQRIFNGVPKAPHMGLDIAAPTGTPIVAPAPGIVTFVQPDQYLNGGVVVIDHGHGVSSTFIHMHRIDVSIGDRLAQGDPVGQVGATGRTTGPHLHWGLNWFDVQLDPWPLLPPPGR